MSNWGKESYVARGSFHERLYLSLKYHSLELECGFRSPFHQPFLVEAVRPGSERQADGRFQGQDLGISRLGAPPIHISNEKTLTTLSSRVA